MIRLRLEALALGVAARLGRRGPNRELERFARELSDLTRGDAPRETDPSGQPSARRAR
ncbi:MAG: hypothetical protein ACYCPV_06615 [Thermoplasmata archaeon]